MATLIHLHYSPWSEKARWALDHHGVEVSRREYLPMLEEPLLRLRTKRLLGRVSVPVLLTDEGAVFDSFAIARWSEERGQGSPLFPSGRDREIGVYDDWSERMLSAGRALTAERASTRSDVLKESVPRPLGSIPGVGVAFGRVGVRFLAGKYRFSPAQAELYRAALRDGLLALRAGLGGRQTLLDEFSYADITMAVALQFVSPVADEWVRLGRASRQVWTEPELAREFSDLVDWRDGLYARKRGSRS